MPLLSADVDRGITPGAEKVGKFKIEHGLRFMVLELMYEFKMSY